MCRYCVEYGDGNKWYLNPKNYTAELSEAPPHAEAIAALGGAGKNTFEMNIAAGADPVEAASLANHAAGLVVAKVGTASVTADELVSDLARWP